MPIKYNYFSTVPRNMERLLAEELEELGAKDVQQTVAGVSYRGTLEVGYRATLWSRLANTVLLQFAEMPAASPEELYEGVREIPWDEHMDVDGTLAVSFTSIGSEINHTKYGALKVKDAIVDQFRDKYGRRPDVDLKRPDIRINCHVNSDEATLSIDLAGESLHRRSYRKDWGSAPLKENVAAAVLTRANWPEMRMEGRPLFDPMCGSGTLLIEGAMMTADQAPGLLRDYFGCLKWGFHDAELWEELIDEAEQRAEAGREQISIIKGSDSDKSVLRMAQKNAKAAGFEDYIEFEHKSVKDIDPPAGRSWPGLLVTNAPYGERLGDEAGAIKVHEELGAALRERFPGWKASVLTGSEELGYALGLSADKVYHLFNGRLECLLLNFSIFER